MEINSRKEGDILILALNGKMDAVTAPEFDRKFEGLTSEGENIFIINFSGLEYISSAGLRSILASAKLLKAKGGRIALTELRGPVKEVFELSGFYSIFQIYGSEAEAVSRIK